MTYDKCNYEKLICHHLWDDRKTLVTQVVLCIPLLHLFFCSSSALNGIAAFSFNPCTFRAIFYFKHQSDSCACRNILYMNRYNTIKHINERPKNGSRQREERKTKLKFRMKWQINLFIGTKTTDIRDYKVAIWFSQSMANVDIADFKAWFFFCCYGNVDEKKH